MSYNKRRRWPVLAAAVIAFAAAALLYYSGGTPVYQFNRLTRSVTGSIPTGEWEFRAPGGNFFDYLDSFPSVITDAAGNQADIRDYVKHIVLGAQSPPALRPQFEGYSARELEEFVESVKDFAKHFMYNRGGKMELPESADTAFKRLETSHIPAGGHVFLPLLILPAQFDGLTYHTAVTLCVRLEGEGDISNYAAEVLIDAKPFDSAQPFSYNYRVIDRQSWNINRANYSVAADQSLPVPLGGQTAFAVGAYRNRGGGFEKELMALSYQKPGGAALWSRFAVGPSLELGAPSPSAHGSIQQFMPEDPDTRAGLIFSGRPDGRAAELRVDIPVRNPAPGQGRVTAIPLTLALCRARGATGPAIPEVWVKVIAGNVWTGG